MSFIKTDPQSHQGKTNTWLTPLWIIDEVGPFDLDPCGLEYHRTAQKIIQLPKCGLTEDWGNSRVWLNPPYGKEQQAWLQKLKTHGSGIALIFARLETKWIQPFIRDGFFQIEGRIRFLKSDLSEDSNAGTGSILIPFSRFDLGMILKSNLKGTYFK